MTDVKRPPPYDIEKESVFSRRASKELVDEKNSEDDDDDSDDEEDLNNWFSRLKNSISNFFQDLWKKV